MTWNPAQYERFKNERSRPFFDLLALVRPAPGARAVDLGCGTGELTRVLHERLGTSETLGLDSSPEMLARSEAFAGGGLRFTRADMATFADERAWDVIFSNAALHWVSDHPALFGRLTRGLRDGGQLAIQMPANHDHLSHRVARAVAAEPEFAAAGGLPEPPVLSPEAYALLLHQLGFREQSVRLEVYGHLLESRAQVIEWVTGTTLTPLRARLDDAGWARFLARYGEALLPQLDDARPYFYTFKRLLLWAQR
ncbi:MAG TPA: methyltransferase domain-containing protein [Polyangia bacterium]|nr:methyltransferase domain-containing protein [Polyangia bacterium]